MLLRTVTLPCGHLRFYDDGIVQVTHPQGSTLRRTDVEAIFSSLRQHAAGRVGLLVDRRKSFDLDFPAMRLIQRELSQHARAIAYLVDSGVGYGVASFRRDLVAFTGIPGNVFFAQDEAEAWLRAMVRQPDEP
ncbi:MAG: hypothetical protein GVY18_14385 [Bacteroidetes bacterium]|jgi:hypothetical protein|nr:hypothetical protein [Bacteroidota bacterium]